MADEQKSNVERIKVFQGEDGQWYFDAIAGNNKVVSTSGGEGYTRHEDALAAAATEFPWVEAQSVTTVFNEAEEGGNSMSQQEQEGQEQQAPQEGETQQGDAQQGDTQTEESQGTENEGQ